MLRTHIALAFLDFLHTYTSSLDIGKLGRCFHNLLVSCGSPISRHRLGTCVDEARTFALCFWVRNTDRSNAVDVMQKLNLLHCGNVGLICDIESWAGWRNENRG